FDVVAATWIFALVRLRHPDGPLPVLGSCLVLAAPTVILNGAAYAQCDVIYASFLAGAVYFMCRGHGGLAVVSAAVAFSFKAQAVFIAPFFLMMLAAGRLRWQWLFLAPVVVVALLLPAWLAGRPLLELVSIYG